MAYRQVNSIVSNTNRFAISTSYTIEDTTPENLGISPYIDFFSEQSLPAGTFNVIGYYTLENTTDASMCEVSQFQFYLGITDDIKTESYPVTIDGGDSWTYTIARQFTLTEPQDLEFFTQTTWSGIGAGALQRSNYTLKITRIA
jgi:hypothetical protein